MTAVKSAAEVDILELAARAVSCYQQPIISPLYPSARPPHRIRAIIRWHRMRRNKRRREKENGTNLLS